MEQNYNFKNNTRAKLQQYWNEAFKSANEDKMSTREFNLPLARIKRLMKVEEEVKMVASEVPILFSKVTEKFVEELTARAWINTEENKRRILQKIDLGAAVKTSDMFDFLIYIIPRSETMSGIDFDQRKYDNNVNLINEHIESEDEDDNVQ
ncbi:CCAAT- binding transcription factor component [Conglomerata obtusa]